MSYAEIPVKDSYDFNGVSQYHGPCICCGKDVKNPAGFVHMVDGGGKACTEDEDERERHSDGDVGLQPIGEKCLDWLKESHPEFVKLYVRKP